MSIFFASVLSVYHPDIFKFLSKLTGEQAYTEMCRRIILRGKDPTPRKRPFCREINDWLPLLAILKTVGWLVGWFLGLTAL